MTNETTSAERALNDHKMIFSLKRPDGWEFGCLCGAKFPRKNYEASYSAFLDHRLEKIYVTQNGETK